MTGQPRVLWSAPAEMGDYLSALGQRNGSPVFRLGNAFITLTPGKAPVSKRYDLEDWRPAGNDAVRDSKLLLLGAFEPKVFSGAPTPFKCDVALLDLDTGTVKKVGKIPGGWTSTTAVPHPRVFVTWISKESADQRREFGPRVQTSIALMDIGFGSVGFVHEETLKIWTTNSAE